MTVKLSKKLFEPLNEGPIAIESGNGHHVSYALVKNYVDGLKEIARKKRTSIAAVLSKADQATIVAKHPTARSNRKEAKTSRGDDEQ